jgi:hypothetical protein
MKKLFDKPTQNTKKIVGATIMFYNVVVPPAVTITTTGSAQNTHTHSSCVLL